MPNNPVLDRPQAFQRAQGYSQPYGAGQAGYAPSGQGPQGYGQPMPPYGQAPQASGGLMTIEDVITKTATVMGVLFLTAAASYFFMPISLVAATSVVMAIVAFVTVMVVSLRPRVSPGAVMAYAVVEGIFIGGLSKLMEYSFPGIVAQAVFGTFVAAAVVLVAYRHLGLRLSGRMQRIVTFGTIALAVLYLINLILALFHVNTGMMNTGPEAGVLSFVISAVAIFCAVGSLLQDFQTIEAGVSNGAPASESWRAAFGVTVTMVWLYTELLRVFSYFRN